MLFEKFMKKFMKINLEGKLLAYKILRYGYYKPIMRKDAVELVRRCEVCQKYVNLQHQPVSQLISIIALWPFAQQKIDILGL